jgi:hypothetical protein
MMGIKGVFHAGLTRSKNLSTPRMTIGQPAHHLFQMAFLNFKNSSSASARSFS